MLPDLKSVEKGFSPLSQRESFDLVEGPVNSEEKIDKAVWECFEFVDLALHLVISEIFKHSRRLLGQIPKYALEDDKLFD